jgi:hypothetical protein
MTMTMDLDVEAHAPIETLREQLRVETGVARSAEAAWRGALGRVQDQEVELVAARVALDVEGRKVAVLERLLAEGRSDRALQGRTIQHLEDVALSERATSANLALLLSAAGDDLAMLRSERDLLDLTVRSIETFIRIARQR